MNDFFAAIEFMQRIRKRQAKWVLPDFAMAVAYRRGGCRVSGTGLRGAVLWSSAPTADVAKIEAPLLLHYAELIPESTRAGPLTRRR